MVGSKLLRSRTAVGGVLEGRTHRVLDVSFGLFLCSIIHSSLLSLHLADMPWSQVCFPLVEPPEALG